MMKRYCLLILLLLNVCGLEGLSLEQAGISPQDPYALWNALCGGCDNDAIKALIANGADPNEEGPAGETPLHAAVNYREDYSEEIVLLLIEAGANLEAQGGDLRETPLHFAFCRGNGRIKQIKAHITLLSLLRIGANPQARNSKGETPLHYAARYNMRILGKLLKYNSVDVKDYAGNTPLHTAVACRNLIMVFGLVYFGADLTAVNNEGKTPLDLLAPPYEGPSDEAPPDLELPLRHHKVLKTGDKQIDLFDAIVKQNPDAIRELIASGADVNNPPFGENYLYTYLCLTDKNRSIEVVKALIEAGIDVNQRDHKTGEAPLHEAAVSTANGEEVTLLLQGNAYVDIRDNEGNTPLHKAVKDDVFDAALILIYGGADIYAVNQKRERPIDLITSTTERYA